MTIQNCLIANNSHGQVLVRTMERSGGVGGYYSGDRFDGSVKDVNLKNNTLIGKKIVPPDYVRANWHTPDRQVGGLIMNSTHSHDDLYEKYFLPTLKADGNTYYHADTEAAFSTGENDGWTRVTFEEWKTRYGVDAESTWKQTKITSNK